MVVKKQAKPLLVDRLTYVAAILEPLITLPQVYQIFHQRTAAGVSLTSWIGYEALTLVWLWYGIVHKERVIIVYQGLFALFQIAIIVGGIMYGAKW
jgi:uncharacterized protein with PQ loop repeat